MSLIFLYRYVVGCRMKVSIICLLNTLLTYSADYLTFALDVNVLVFVLLAIIKKESLLNQKNTPNGVHYE